MKRFKYMAFALCAAALLSACSEDSLDSQSVIGEKANAVENNFDKWLKANFLDPYNVKFAYRYDDIETDLNYYHVPAEYNQAVKLAHMVKYACLEAYDEVGGIAFTRANFPKILFLTGEFEYEPNGTMKLGVAEGGRKIYLHGVNHLDEYSTNLQDLNDFYLATIYHEFTHILNQTKDYSPDYKLITGSTYLSDSWSDEGARGYLDRGYISAYSQKEHKEDFAEMLSIYITTDPDTWDEWMNDASIDDSTGEAADGATYLQQKLDMVRTYMQESWGIDLEALRTTVLKRQQNIINGYVDLTNLTVD